MWDSEQSKAPFRTETDSTEFVAMVTKAPSRNIDALRKVQGAHGQRFGLWGFNGSAPLNRIPVTLTERTAKAVKEAGSSSPWTDIHLAVAGETMHEIDLGILKYAQAAVLYHLRETRGKTDQEIERINDGLRLSMTHESRWQGLDYPPTKKITGMIQGYFGGSSRVEADEHSSVLQFLVLILTRFLGMDDPATRLMARLISYYRARQVRPDEPLPGYRVHTESSLEEVDVLFDQIRTALDEVGPPVKSTEDTPKMHQQLHYRLQVMRLGTTSITTGQAGEANNARIKRPIKTGRTNNQKTAVLRTIVKLYRRSRAVRSFSKDVQREGRTCRLPARTKRYRTSELIAVQRDLCVYPNQRYIGGNLRFTILDIHKWTRNHVGPSFRPRQMASRDVTTDLRRDLFDILSVDSLKDQDTPLNRRLEFILDDRTIGRAFVGELPFFLTGEDSNTTVSEGFNLTIKIVQSAANPSVYTKSSRLDTRVRLVQKVRAAPNYRKTDKVWYDFVTLSAVEPEKGDDVWYARVILLFYIRDPKKAGKWQQLAFVRYLTRQETRQDELRRRKRPGEPQVTPFIYTRRQRRTKLVWYYGVCSSESILRVVHIVAGNDEGSHSLRFSRGDRQFFEVDRKAKFLLNYNVFESAKEPYYRPTILDRDQDDSSSDGEEPDSD